MLLFSVFGVDITYLLAVPSFMETWLMHSKQRHLDTIGIEQFDFQISNLRDVVPDWIVQSLHSSDGCDVPDIHSVEKREIFSHRIKNS